MFPVSGAEQFTDSEASCPHRPRTSAITAYCTNETYKQHDEGILTCLQVGERNAILGIVYLGKKEVPKAAFAGFCLELLKNWDLRLPAKLRVGWKLGFSNLEGRFNLLLWCVHGRRRRRVRMRA